MKIYLRAILLFCIGLLPALGLRFILKSYFGEPFLHTSFIAFWALVSILLIRKIEKRQWKLFQPFKLNFRFLILIIVLILLFVLNNYFQAVFSDNRFYSDTIKGAIGTYFLSYLISSAAQEIIFRGLIQTYVNKRTSGKSFIISKGNLVATILFFVIHIGFFTIMDLTFAVTSLFNVLIFSLIAGYLYDKTKNILFLISLHIVLNMVHLFIQFYF